MLCTIMPVYSRGPCDVKQADECMMNWCMQVPSFDSKVAMAMIEQELGRPWQQVYSQLTPRPIAAASLGQVRIITAEA